MSKLFAVGKSGNAAGRPKGSKYSILTTKGRIERFLGRNMTARAMQDLYTKLTPKDQTELLTSLLPYVLPKQSNDAISPADVDRLYEEIMKGLENNNLKADGKATG
ncbi:hypothetical protein MD537_14775 [Flavihumibacter sediminis]|nr:hypothetical protein [Flavihumibacter sediminis]